MKRILSLLFVFGLILASTSPVLAARRQSGECGAADGESFASKPTTHLCDVGSASSVSGKGPWSWTCSGVGGGSTADCSANLIVNGACGSANKSGATKKPTANLCSAGSATTVKGSGPWTWSCDGSNGGTNASCTTQSSAVNGSCGSANGGTFSSTPTSGLCNTGTATGVSGTGPWAWSCDGSGGGTTASCSAQTSVVNGACGSSNGEALTSKPTGGLCNAGTASAVSGAGPWTWTCSGKNGGSTASCDATVESTTPPGLLPAGYLSTSGNQIVDDNGNPVRLHCVGWNGMNSQYSDPDNLEAVNYETLMNVMVTEGFNCIRMSWNDVTLMTNSAPAGINYTVNPTLKGLTQMQVEDAIVAYAGQIGLKLILDHHDNNATGTGPNAWACSGQQANGLWYDLGPGTNGTDGCGNTGTVTQQIFMNNWIAIAQRYANNPTVIGFDLDNEPSTVNAATWGDGSITDIREMYSTVGSAIQAVDPGVLIIAEGPAVFNWERSTLLSGAPLLQTGIMDLSLAGTEPVTLTVPHKLVYSIHDYPASISSATPDSGPNMITTMNGAWGYLVAQNIAPVWIGEMGASLDGTNDSAGSNLTDEQTWAAQLVAYLNGQDGAEGGPTFSGNQQPIGTDWWTFGYLYGNQSPDGTLESDFETPNPYQQAVYDQLAPVAH